MKKHIFLTGVVVSLLLTGCGSASGPSSTGVANAVVAQAGAVPVSDGQSAAAGTPAGQTAAIALTDGFSLPTGLEVARGAKISVPITFQTKEEIAGYAIYMSYDPANWKMEGVNVSTGANAFAADMLGYNPGDFYPDRKPQMRAFAEENSKKGLKTMEIEAVSLHNFSGRIILAEVVLSALDSGSVKSTDIEVGFAPPDSYSLIKVGPGPDLKPVEVVLASPVPPVTTTILIK